MSHTQAVQMALHIIGDLRKNGFLVIPVTPTQEMLNAGAKAGQVSTDVAAQIFKAMIHIASKDTPDIPAKT